MNGKAFALGFVTATVFYGTSAVVAYLLARRRIPQWIVNAEVDAVHDAARDQPLLQAALPIHDRYVPPLIYTAIQEALP